MGVTNGSFIDACYRRNNGRLPIWIMRQAGRYLPEYRAIRERASFKELCSSPDLIAEVVWQPIDRFGLDAAILFSDILTMLEPMGMKVEFPEGGPRIMNPISSPDDVDRLRLLDIQKELSFVLDGIRSIRERLPETPIIGFVGSPFTLSCYMIEGQGSKTFDKAKKFLHQYPEAGEKLLGLLSDAITEYLKAQVDAGADAIQLFQSWDGILSHDSYINWSAKPANKIFSALAECNCPRIMFVNNVAPYLDVVRDIDCEVVGIDYRISLSTAAQALPNKAVQGNLDPAVLFKHPDEVVARTTSILDSLDDLSGLIFNLGHGILPGTPVESVDAMVRTVHSYR